MDVEIVRHSTEVDGVTYSYGSDVTLGSRVDITFESVGQLTEGFFINSCTASNNDGDVRTELVIDGCANLSTQQPIPAISPALSKDSTRLSFDQFAYVSKGKNKLNTVECGKFGVSVPSLFWI